MLELERHNDIQLFKSGPGGAKSDIAKRSFELKQQERLQALTASRKEEDAFEDLLALFASVSVADNEK